MHELYDIFHMLGVVLFFCGIIASLVWLRFAEKSGRPDALRTAVKRAHTVNMFVTAPGIALITVSGVLQTSYAGHLHSQSWLVIGLMLFAFSLLIWLVFFIPAQKKLLHSTIALGNSFPGDFFTTLHRLYFFGALIIILPLGTMTLSIAQPQLW